MQTSTYSHNALGTEILLSADRLQMPPVYGTAVPPEGRSGQLRKWAFRYTESDLRHWMILLLADRVNVVEGIMADFRQGHIPNFFEEMGLKSEFKYNKKSLLKKLAIAAGGIFIVYLLKRR